MRSGVDVMEVDVYGTTVPPGSLIVGGRYRVDRLLQQRPRVNLYLGHRILPIHDAEQPHNDIGESLVAIRELDLSALPQLSRSLVEGAAFEEFVSPVVAGSPRISSVPDRVTTEDERHYFIMQLERAGSQVVREQHEIHEKPLLLADLFAQELWPWWLDSGRAIQWGGQLCRIAARLHRLGTVLGDLSPLSVLVDGEGSATWSPILLPSWPPPLRSWLQAASSISGIADPTTLYYEVFPIVEMNRDNPFIAPEIEGGDINERTDVYSLGAILYLLLTHYAPVAAWRRLDAVHAYGHTSTRQHTEPLMLAEDSEGLALIPPSLLNARISSPLEHVLLRALALDPAERYSSAFALAEVIEALENR